MASGYNLDERGERTLVNVGGKRLRPCGTHAAFQRHRERDEEPCAACAEAEVRWQRYKKVRDKYKRQRRSGASADELGLLNRERLRLELEYRSLEQTTDTPQPPSRRWKVYRFDFDDGSQYVGITQRSVAARAAEHTSGSERLTGGSAEISRLVAEGVDYKLYTIATNLTQAEAEEMERSEIAKLPQPLNIKGRIKG